jgi:hypothetical protein
MRRARIVCPHDADNRNSFGQLPARLSNVVREIGILFA